LRDRDADPDEIHYLNSLCVRAYAFLYANAHEEGDPRAGRASLRERAQELALELRSAFARSWQAQLVSWGLLLVGGLLGAALTSQNPDALYALVPANFGYSPDTVDRLWSSAEAREDFLAREEVSIGQNAWFGSVLFTHNTRVGLLAFAAGILAGIPTVLLQLYNGLVLGALSAVFFRDALPVAYLAWLLPHAVPELTAISLCASAGLMLGGAIAAPGRLGRGLALREAAQSAVVVAASSVPLFLLAALTESFVRESELGLTPRFAIAGTYTVALLAALVSIRSLARRERVETGWLRDLI